MNVLEKPVELHWDDVQPGDLVLVHDSHYGPRLGFVTWVEHDRGNDAYTKMMALAVMVTARRDNEYLTPQLIHVTDVLVKNKDSVRLLHRPSKEIASIAMSEALADSRMLTAGGPRPPVPTLMVLFARAGAIVALCLGAE